MKYHKKYSGNRTLTPTPVSTPTKFIIASLMLRYKGEQRRVVFTGQARVDAEGRVKLTDSQLLELARNAGLPGAQLNGIW